jgi:CRP-like cAMP-binding protein
MQEQKEAKSSFKRPDEVLRESSAFYENELFKGLQPAELKLLFRKMRVQVYKAGNIIFMPEDQSCERLYLLSRGRIEMYRLTPNGKHLVTRHILPGGIFGVRGLFARRMQKNFAEALEDSSIGVITREQVLEHLKLQPELMLQILENVSSRLYLLEDRLVETVYNPVTVRLAYFLLSNADAATGTLNAFTHEEIGNQIGSVRQTITEKLGLMSKQGLIKTKPGQIRIIDRDRLEEMVRNREY